MKVLRVPVTTHTFGDSAEGLRGSCNHSYCSLQQKATQQDPQWKDISQVFPLGSVGLLLWSSAVKCRNMCSVFAQISPLRLRVHTSFLL